MRYGSEKKLVFALPQWGNYYNWNYGHKFKTSDAVEAPFFVDAEGNLSRKKLNILSHHTQFNYEPMRTLMPNDSVFISIIRDPVRLFESVFYYVKLNERYNCTLEEFFLNPDYYCRN